VTRVRGEGRSGTPEVHDEEESRMSDETVHEDNATPTATDDDVKRMDADTPNTQDTAAEGHGVGENPTDSHDTDENADPKSGGTPVMPAAGAEERGDTDAVDNA
jgi:hypothetical protein